MNIRRFLVGAAIAGTFAVSSVANAAIINLEWAGFANGTERGDITTITSEGTNNRTNIRVGMMTFNPTLISGDSPIDMFSKVQAFCLESNISLVLPDADYQVEAPEIYFSEGTLANVNQLFSKHLRNTGTAETDAAFQLALWKLLYDGGANIDFGSGNFQASGFGGALALAGNWLAALGSGATFNGDLWALKSPIEGSDIRSQDLITWQVPEPGTLALLGAGLIAFGAMRRRRLH